MKLGYFADGLWAHKALDRLLQSEDLTVAFIVARFDQPDPILREYACRMKIPFYTQTNVNDPGFIRLVHDHQCDIHVSMSFDQIFKKTLIESAPKGFINCHAGALPFYRGRNVVNWALINGETQLGITVHYVDEGIDTGDIILQRFVPIDAGDDYGTLLTKAVDYCAEILSSALLSIAHGTVTRIPQSSIHPVGFYCSQRKSGDEWIDWTWPSTRIHNFVRGIATPGPCARTCAESKELAVLKTELVEHAPGYLDRPGTVVGLDGHGSIVKTGDTVLRVTKVADVAPLQVLENERVPRLKIGTQLKGE
ncbi:methionyl-tRNA formyltransferase [Geomesophilobacter sediminis]|uniref:Methionyl-tRNA formyltransferase n=1 Tax=Geomesophilobacter sediminis TaxID=2798584 RepID=A0A8J7J9B6_9BACT|nr:methionyl-tRNA formyltransferase [Geomesophilobacter sediminis]MBJ6723156.1 methionyl-tRNA formyltransferase [Geomesophilobacter sediminis]